MLRFWADGRKITAQCESDGTPLRFFMNGHCHTVEEVIKQWQLEDAWWAAAQSRSYFKVTTDTGLLVLLYWDWVREKWYLQRIYD